MSTTTPTNTVFDGSSYYFLPWGEIKPYIQIASQWEDISFRIEASNQINNLRHYIVILSFGLKTSIININFQIFCITGLMCRLDKKRNRNS